MVLIQGFWNWQLCIIINPIQMLSLIQKVVCLFKLLNRLLKPIWAEGLWGWPLKPCCFLEHRFSKSKRVLATLVRSKKLERFKLFGERWFGIALYCLWVVFRQLWIIYISFRLSNSSLTWLSWFPNPRVKEVLIFRILINLFLILIYQRRPRLWEFSLTS